VITAITTITPITAITALAGSVITAITITAITAITAGSAALRLHEAASLALAGGQGNCPPPGCSESCEATRISRAARQPSGRAAQSPRLQETRAGSGRWAA
jgi:hypothetical protein